MTVPFAAQPDKSRTDTDQVKGRFLALVPGQRVVQQVTFESDDPAFAGAMTMTWHLATEARGTRVTVVAQDVPSGISRKDHERGWPRRWATWRNS